MLRGVSRLWDASAAIFFDQLKRAGKRGLYKSSRARETGEEGGRGSPNQVVIASLWDVERI